MNIGISRILKEEYGERQLLNSPCPYNKLKSLKVAKSKDDDGSGVSGR